ncbi:hypothetical protein AVEN_33668-1 [Araneus ventricosus]|uniref:Uncharacterized protein n=1 Tax=Araneus ventricosus TaxID=182803 RepID=A0A4Y2J289_ARAVE|nr:hypothetical protein AVEN_33668-1 [Araneus ventricosus]
MFIYHREGESLKTWLKASEESEVIQGYWVQFLPKGEGISRKRRNSNWCLSGQAYKSEANGASHGTPMM